MVTLRILSAEVVDSTDITVTFTQSLTPNLVPANVSILSQTPGAPDGQVLIVSVSGAVLKIVCQPLTPLAAYYLQFQSVPLYPFQSVNGDSVLSNNSIINRFLITAPISPDNPVANYLGSFYNGSIYDAMQNPDSIVSQYINSLSVNLARALYDIGQLKNENYLELDIIDEQKVRGAGAFDRLNQEGAYLVSRVGKGPTNATLPGTIIFTDFPSFPVTLQGQTVSETLLPNSVEQVGFFNINTLDLNLQLSPVTQLLSVVFNLSVANLTYTYDIQELGYQLLSSRYDQNYASTYLGLLPNQVRLSEQILSDPLFSLDNILNVQVQYQYKNLGVIVDPTTVTVTTPMPAIREVLPPIINVFSLQHAPIIDGSGDVATFGGVTFIDPNQSTPGALHPAFIKEIPFSLSALPSAPGIYSINYSVGQVYVYGATLTNDGTGPSPPLATYTYLLTYQSQIDYAFDDTSSDLVSLPPGNLVNNAGTINFEYEQVFVPGVDYNADVHIESLEEHINNNLIALNALTTQNSPITNVFQIFNQTTGEIYTLNRWYNNIVYFQYNNPPNIVALTGERAAFNLITNELLFVNSTVVNADSLNILQIDLANNTLVAGTEDTTASSFNTSLVFSDGNVFVKEKWFSREFTPSININRLQNIGEYMVDYLNGVVYVAVSVNQSQSLSTASYRNDQIDPVFPHLISVEDIYYRISPLLPKNAEFAYTTFGDDSIVPAVLNPSDEMYLNGNTTAPYQLYNGSVGIFMSSGFIPGVTYQVKYVRSVFEYSDLLNSTNPINFASYSTSNNFNINVGSIVKQTNEYVQFDGTNYYVIINENIPYLSPNIQFTFSVIRNSDGAQLWDSLGVVVPGNPVKLILPGIHSTMTGNNVTVKYIFTINNISRVVVDYNKGDYFIDYTYLADEILVSYEYGDNYLDFRDSLSINTNDTYYVSYKAGALRDALLKNFGTLVNIQELANVDLTFDRQRYRECLQAALSSFVVGPTIPAIKNIGKIISHIEPELIESAFQSWTLGQGLLNPQPITTTGNIQLLPAKFGNGALINQPGQSVKFPAHSNLRLEEGTFETWIVPEWNGLDNNSTLTFTITQDGYPISPGSVFIGSAGYHPMMVNGIFSLTKDQATGTPNTNKDGVFIYYDKDMSGSFSRWYVRTIDGYVELDHVYPPYKFFIQTAGTIYDNKSLTYPKPTGMSYFTGTNNITLNITGGTAAPIPGPPSPPIPPAPPILNLGVASTFGVLASSTITNTGPTIINGDLGLTPGSAVTGAPTVTGATHIDDVTAVSAQSAALVAFTFGNLLTPTTTFLPIHDIGGATLSPGVYFEPSSLGITGTVTLDAGGDTNAYWVFQIGSTLTTAAGASIVSLVNGAQAANVFWLVGSSATLGTNTAFIGTIIALASVTATTVASIDGRLLALTAAVTLDDNDITVPPSPPPTPGPPSPNDGYVGIDLGLTFLSDPDQYILDFGKSHDQSRLSIFKDASGYINFRAIGKDKRVYTVSADVSAWLAGQQHFVAASWKLNTYNNQDEMHLFIDGFEVPNIIKYGQALQPYLHEKFRTINPEEIAGLVNRDIVGSSDLTTTAGSTVVNSSLNFSSFNISVGDTIIIQEIGFLSTGYTIEVINGQTLVLNLPMPASLPGDGRYTINQTSFVVTSDINVAPSIEVTTIHAMPGMVGGYVTGSLGSNFINSPNTDFTITGVEPGFLIRIDNNSLPITYTIWQVLGHTLKIDAPLPINVGPTDFQIYSHVENELPGINALSPDYSISQGINFENILTLSNDVFAGDLVLVRTLGINYRDINQQYYIWSNQVENILMTRLPPPISLDQAEITKIIVPNTAIGPSNSTLIAGQFVSNHLPGEHPSNSQAGRTLSATISGTNVNFSSPVQVTISGVSGFLNTTETILFTNYGTLDFVNIYTSVYFINVVVTPINPLTSALAVVVAEKYPITYSEFSGLVPVVRYSYYMGGGYTLFNDPTISPYEVRDNNNTFSGLDIGNYLVITSPGVVDGYSVAGFYIITGVSTDFKSLTIQPTYTSGSVPLPNFSNGIYQVLNVTQYRSGLQNGFFTLEASLMPGQAYFLSRGFYDLAYSTYMSVKFEPLNQYCYLGSDFHGNNQINATLNQVKIYSVMLTDTRVGEIIPANQNSITKDFNSLKPLKTDSTTLMLITFNTFPFTNSAPMYVSLPSNLPNFQSSFVVNENFDQSIVITNNPIVVPNNGILDTTKEATIEFWVSPLLDTANDPSERTYFDAYGATLVNVVSVSDVAVKISAPASQILSVHLQTDPTGLDYFAGGKLQIDTQRATQEETVSLNANTVLVSDPILQVITVTIANDPTGIDYFNGGSVASNGTTIYLGSTLPKTNLPLIVTYQSTINSNNMLNTQVIRLNRRLPNQNTPVIVNYIPKGLQGDRVRLFKDKSGYINFDIIASGTDFVIRAPTYWARNTWHRIKASYKVNGGVGQDTMMLFLDGYEWSDIRFGSAIFGTLSAVVGASMPGDGYADGYQNVIISNIVFKDSINDLFIGTDYTRNQPVFSLLDNLRVSNIARPIYAPYGEPLDVNYTSNLSVAEPVTQDLYTTYLLNFDSMTLLNTNFATIKNQLTGNFDFTVNILDSFGIVVSSIDTQNTLNTLINVLKPANSRVFINYIE